MAKNLYRDLLVWQKSMALIKEVYALADKFRFPDPLRENSAL
jgi:hypothetical protein